jgi:hypothetical protein
MAPKGNRETKDARTQCWINNVHPYSSIIYANQSGHLPFMLYSYRTTIVLFEILTELFWMKKAMTDYGIIRITFSWLLYINAETEIEDVDNTLPFCI